MSDLIHIRSECEEVTHGYTRERAVHALGLIADYKRLLRDMEDQVWAAMQADVEANGPIELGTRRWYVATKRETKVRDMGAALTAIADAVGGDWAAFADTLSVNAIKPGAARKVLGDKFSEVFSEETVTELREGKAVPVKELREIDTRFTGK